MTTSSLYSGQTPDETPVTRTFSQDEWLIIRDALIETEIHARQNEKDAMNTVKHGCGSLKDVPLSKWCDDCRIAEYERTDAARRAMAFRQLADRIG